MQIKKKKIIVVTKERNPRLYGAVLRKGGRVMFSNIIMTIHPIKVPEKSFIENVILKLKSLFKQDA